MLSKPEATNVVGIALGDGGQFRLLKTDNMAAGVNDGGVDDVFARWVIKSADIPTKDVEVWSNHGNLADVKAVKGAVQTNEMEGAVTTRPEPVLIQIKQRN